MCVCLHVSVCVHTCMRVYPSLSKTTKVDLYNLGSLCMKHVRSVYLETGTQRHLVTCAVCHNTSR